MEWVRFIILLICVFIGINLMHIWYLLGINTIYGIGCYIYIHTVRFSPDGKACADVQQYRAGHLLAEVIIFWTTFVIMSFPQLLLKTMNSKTLVKALEEPESDEDESDKKEKKSDENDSSDYSDSDEDGDMKKKH